MLSTFAVDLSSRSALKWAAFACCFAAYGQDSPNDWKAIMEHIHQGPRRPFAECDGSYYLQMQLPVLICGDLLDGKRNAKTDCAAVIEYTPQNFAIRTTNRSPADKQNGIEWKGFLTMSYATSRARHIADGKWGTWEKWEDKVQPTEPALIIEAEKTNGRWQFTTGPDLFKIPISIDQLTPPRPFSCSDITNPNPHEGVPVQSTPVGGVVAVDPAANTIIVKSDKGGTESTFTLENTRTMLRVDAGARDLKGAVRITPRDFKVSDRVNIRYKADAGVKLIPAISVLLTP